MTCYLLRYSSLLVFLYLVLFISLYLFLSKIASSNSYPKQDKHFLKHKGCTSIILIIHEKYFDVHKILIEITMIFQFSFYSPKSIYLSPVVKHYGHAPVCKTGDFGLAWFDSKRRDFAGW